MSFSVSPAITVREFDLSGYISNVSQTVGAVGGVFKWGPIEDRQFVTSQQSLVAQFGKPTSNNFETWFVASNYLDYSSSLYVTRAADGNTFNASAGNGAIANTQIKNAVDYTQKSATLNSNGYFYAKYAGDMGNSLKISVCDSAQAFYSTLTGNSANLVATFVVNSNVATLAVTGANTTNANTEATAIANALTVGDIVTAGNSTIGKQYMKVTSIGAVTTNGAVATLTLGLSNRYSLSANVAQTTLPRNWEYFNSVDTAPGTSTYVAARGGVGDELHIVVADEDGQFTGTPGSILEIWPGISRATDARGEQGGSIFYKDVLNNSSSYVWAGANRPGMVTNTAVNITGISTLPYTVSFTNGYDSVSESAISLSALAAAYDQYKSAEDVDISVILAGKAIGGVNGEGLANYIIDNIVDVRKDCVVVISPDRADVVNNPYGEVESLIQFRQSLRSTSYGFLDGNYKQQYDRYNDVYRWVPLNGDVAGTFARTDADRDPWYSPAGYNRGGIKNVFKLAFNPDKALRDLMYKNGINPIITQGNSGPILFGDKTLLDKTSAFDRINVRRLFIVLEKAIATAQKGLLFEFNDAFTRTQFRNLVVPYLRDIMGRRGIIDFRVVADETNNTSEIIDNNQFVGDIYIKPAKSINEIQLNFVAVRTGVDFQEIVGKFG